MEVSFHRDPCRSVINLRAGSSGVEIFQSDAYGMQRFFPIDSSYSSPSLKSFSFDNVSFFNR